MAAKNNPGRKKRPCKANYNAARKWVANKVRRIQRHVKRFPNDEQSLLALGKAQSAV